MATLPPSLALHSTYLKRRAGESSKRTVTAHCMCRNKQKCGLRNMEKKLFCGEVAQSVLRSHRTIGLEKFTTLQVSVEETELVSTTGTLVDEQENVSIYQFRTEAGGLVKVFVRKISVKYAVYIEVSSLHVRGSNDGLVLSWGMYRADSSSLMPFDVQTSVSDARTIETPLKQTSLGNLAVELDIKASQIPLYLSFLLRSPLVADVSSSDIRSHKKANFVVPVGFSPGSPFPLGLSFSKDGSMNFSLFSRKAEHVVLCLYDDTEADKPALELDLDPYVNRSGDIWHVSLQSARNFIRYGYRCKGILQGHRSKLEDFRVLLDPYAKLVETLSSDHTSGLAQKYLGSLCKEPVFDWSGDVCPNLPIEKLVVYGLNVMRFTEHKSSKLPADVAGTFAGLAEKVHHLKDLGVNAILLEPIFQFDEQKGPYYPSHFFSPMNAYGPSAAPVSVNNSMKEMVKKFHANGIEVLLEVVFTHTSESGSLLRVDDSSYFHVKGDLWTRNALNCNYPIVQQIILDSLRHWVTEFHVDGFCFINALSLLRGFHGEYLSRPPLLEAIAFDPLLSNTKIVADCCDSGDLGTNETHFPHWKRWAEKNTKFCSDVRNFLRGEGLLSNLATRLCGSGDTFSDGRGPAFSFNFISRNFGLPLVDLVSFSVASELSWNCGEEGPTTKKAVLERRLKQIRNFLFILYISLGVPVLNMGDECGLSSGGSPAYDDNKPFDWSALRSGFGIQMTKFISFFSSFRARRADLLQKRNFLRAENIVWHGSDQSPPTWEDPSCKFLAMTLKADKTEGTMKPEPTHIKGDLFVAFNAADNAEAVILPHPPKGMAWRRLVDTALPYPGFFSMDGELVLEQMTGLFTYEMKSHSCTLFEASSHIS